MINPYLIIGLIVFWLASLLGAEQYGDHARGLKEGLKTAQIQLADAKLIQDNQAVNESLKSSLEVQRENDNDALNTLLSVQPARVLLPKCKADQADPASGSVQAIAASGVLFTETERILDSDRQSTWQIIGAAEQELTDCRVSKEWAKAQGK